MGHTSGMPNTREAGQSVAHYRNGRVKFRGSWLEGDMHAAWERFRTDGSLMRTGKFDRGKQTGTWRTYDRAGRVVKETTFGRQWGPAPLLDGSGSSGRPRRFAAGQASR